MLKVTALVIVPEVAFSARLYACAAVFKVVAVNAPLNAIVPVVLQAQKLVVLPYRVSALSRLLTRVVPPSVVQ